jgi:ABC-type ATPase involved in cell division
MIDLIDVSKSYGPGLPAVNHANLHIDKGEFVFVVGNSGSGKTTLIKLLMKELDSTSGQIIVSGERLEGMKHRRVAKYRRKLGVVFQDFRLLKDRNVYENVAFAQRVVNRPTRVIRKRVPEVLQEVGLAVKYKSFPDELSGGEESCIGKGAGQPSGYPSGRRAYRKPGSEDFRRNHEASGTDQRQRNHSPCCNTQQRDRKCNEETCSYYA